MKQKRMNETDRGQIAAELEIAIRYGEREQREWMLTFLLVVSLIALLA
jgi:hypothetical protein